MVFAPAAGAAPNGPAGNALLAAQLAGADQAGPVASVGTAAQPLSAPAQTAEVLAAPGKQTASVF
jgi:hypothetical protein